MRENTKLKKFSLNSTAKKTFELNSSQTFISNDLLLKIFRNKNSANHHFQHFRTTI